MVVFVVEEFWKSNKKSYENKKEFDPGKWIDLKEKIEWNWSSNLNQ